MGCSLIRGGNSSKEEEEDSNKEKHNFKYTPKQIKGCANLGTGLSAVIRQKSHVLENFSISVNNKILKWTFSERLTQEHLKIIRKISEMPGFSLTRLEASLTRQNRWGRTGSHSGASPGRVPICPVRTCGMRIQWHRVQFEVKLTLRRSYRRFLTGSDR